MFEENVCFLLKNNYDYYTCFVSNYDLLMKVIHKIIVN